MHQIMKYRDESNVHVLFMNVRMFVDVPNQYVISNQCS